MGSVASRSGGAGGIARKRPGGSCRAGAKDQCRSGSHEIRPVKGEAQPGHAVLPAPARDASRAPGGARRVPAMVCPEYWRPGCVPAHRRATCSTREGQASRHTLPAVLRNENRDFTVPEACCRARCVHYDFRMRPGFFCFRGPHRNAPGAGLSTAMRRVANPGTRSPRAGRCTPVIAHAFLVEQARQTRFPGIAWLKKRRESYDACSDHDEPRSGRRAEPCVFRYVH